MYQEGSNELPKVSAIVSSKPVNEAQALAMLSDFLASEQQKLKRHPHLESSNHWEDIFLVSQTLASSKKERAKLAKLRDLRGIATQHSIGVGEVTPTVEFEQADVVVDKSVSHGEPTSPETKPSPEIKEEPKSVEKSERKAAKKAEKDAKKKRKEDKKERKETKKQKRESKGGE
jgi:outer membrane biosynthesis protein TonB